MPALIEGAADEPELVEADADRELRKSFADQAGAFGTAPAIAKAHMHAAVLARQWQRKPAADAILGNGGVQAIVIAHG